MATYNAELLYQLLHNATLQFAVIDCSSSGDNTIVAAVTGLKIKVASYMLVADGAVTVKWKSDSTSLSGAMSFAANGGASAAPIAQLSGHWLETAAGQALILNLGGAVGVRGHLSYTMGT